MLSVCLCQRIMFSEIWSVMDYVRCRVLQCTLRLIAASGIGACRSNPPRSIRDWAQQEGLLILGKTKKKMYVFLFHALKQTWISLKARMLRQNIMCDLESRVFAISTGDRMIWQRHAIMCPTEYLSESSLSSLLLFNAHNKQQQWHLCKQSTPTPVRLAHPFQ